MKHKLMNNQKELDRNKMEEVSLKAEHNNLTRDPTEKLKTGLSDK